MVPGEYLLASEPIQANAERDTIEIEVANTADRPIQVGSHFHFFEANKALVFPRRLAFGKRLNIAAGTAVRFEPGDRVMPTFAQDWIAGRPSLERLRSTLGGPREGLLRELAVFPEHALVAIPEALDFADDVSGAA